jgi:uncharacterized membrane protein
MTTSSPRDRLWPTFRIPLALALIGLAGLIGALLVSGCLDIFFGLVASIPLITIAVSILVAARRGVRESAERRS